MIAGGIAVVIVGVVSQIGTSVEGMFQSLMSGF